MDPVRRAVGGGVAGTLAMSVVLLIGEAEARFQLGVGGAIARYVGVPGQPAFGLLVFLVAGMFAWPLVFLAVEAHLAWLPGGDDPAVRGMAFSLPLWVVYVALGSPPLGTPEGALHLAFTLFAHLLYGFTLGAVYHSLAEV